MGRRQAGVKKDGQLAPRGPVHHCTDRRGHGTRIPALKLPYISLRWSSFRKVFMQFILLKMQLDGVNVSCGVVKSTVIIRLKSRSGKVFQSHKIVECDLVVPLISSC